MRDAAARLIHDMRNTATAIAGSSAIIRSHRDTLSPAALDSLCEMMDRRVNLLVHLLEDLRNVHELERGEIRLATGRVRLGTVVRQVLADRPVPVGTTVTDHVADDLEVLADGLRVSQVVDNLVTNALRYGGPEITLDAHRDGSQVVLEVRDNGDGVPDDMVPGLFDAYTRGARSIELGGSGLGTAIARHLCEAMRGSIDYRLEDGAVFQVRLPRAPDHLIAPSRDLADDGHVVLLWEHEIDLVDAAATYVAQGIGNGEGVLLVTADARRRVLEDRLRDLGADLDAARAVGQVLVVDAVRLRERVATPDDVDPTAPEDEPAAILGRLANRWAALRVLVDDAVDADDGSRYEQLWSDLRDEHGFALVRACPVDPRDPAVEVVDARHESIVRL